MKSLPKVLSVIFAVVGCVSIKAADDPVSPPVRVIKATYKIYHRDSTATGFVVSGPGGEGTYLVTADHVLRETKGETALLVLRRSLPDGSYKRRDWKLTLRDEKKPLWTRHPDHDIAAIRIELPEDSEVAPLPFAWLAMEAQIKQARIDVASELLLYTFPHRFEANGAGFPVVRRITVASYPVYPVSIHNWFLADFPNFPGDSGGPVFCAFFDDPDSRAARPLLVGIVSERFHFDEHIETVEERRHIKHSLEIGKIFHAGFIRETIQLAAEGKAVGDSEDAKAEETETEEKSEVEADENSENPESE